MNENISDKYIKCGKNLSWKSHFTVLMSDFDYRGRCHQVFIHFNNLATFFGNIHTFFSIFINIPVQSLKM